MYETDFVSNIYIDYIKTILFMAVFIELIS